MNFKLTKASRIWELPVPIVEKDGNIDVFISDEVSAPDTYNELVYRLRTASESDVFTLHLNTPGGYIDSALMIIDAIKASKATVNAHIAGTVASAGTVITLACKDVSVAPHTAFMIHNYSSGMQGKGHEMKAYQTFADKNLNAAFAEMYKGFLTDVEMTDIIDGKDLWLNKEEVEERLARR